MKTIKSFIKSGFWFTIWIIIICFYVGTTYIISSFNPFNPFEYIIGFSLIWGGILIINGVVGIIKSWKE